MSSLLLVSSIFQHINRANLFQDDKNQLKIFNNCKEEIELRAGTFSHHDKIYCIYLRYSKDTQIYQVVLSCCTFPKYKYQQLPVSFSCQNSIFDQFMVQTIQYSYFLKWKLVQRSHFIIYCEAALGMESLVLISQINSKTTYGSQTKANFAYSVALCIHLSQRV